MITARARPEHIRQSCHCKFTSSTVRRLHRTRSAVDTFRRKAVCGLPPPIRDRYIALRRAASFSSTTIDNAFDATTHSKRRHELQNDEDALAEQVAAIEALEEELGMSLEQAMEEDKRLTIKAKKQIESNTGVDSYTEAILNPRERLQRLREAGVAQHDIVREARQSFGDIVPEGALDDQEMQIYRRLYGEPAVETGNDYGGSSVFAEEPANQLFTSDGERVEYKIPVGTAAADAGGSVHNAELTDVQPHGDTGYTDENITTKRSRSETVDDMSNRAQDVAQSLGGTVVDEDIYELEEEEDPEIDPNSRDHPLTPMGRFATIPRTTFMPQEGYIRPVEQLMSNFSNKHLREMCERLFGGPGLPDSPLTPKSGRSRPQVAVPLEAGQHTMGEMEANAFLAAIVPPTYASILSVLVETRKRLGSSWLHGLLGKEGGPRVLDAGSGGAGVLAWREVVQAHWNALHSSQQSPPAPPPSKTVVLTGSDTLRHRAAALLENTTFIPRLPDYVHTRDVPTLDDDRPAQGRKQFDVIIAPHTLFALKEEWQRKQQVQNLWSLLSSEGGVLILIEKGVPRGFEAIAGAREMLLNRHIAIPEGQTTAYSGTADDDSAHQRTTGMIVAPCTNHEKCPMYTVSGLSRGRKDVCSFQQRYIRPQFLQRVLGATDRNHDDVDFSYISVMKGEDLRTRHITSWDHVRDPLSAPPHQDPASLSEPLSSRMTSVREGFESFTPEVEVESSTSNLHEASAHTSQDAEFHADGQQLRDLPTHHSLPRIILPPIKRRGHVTLDLCTPGGKIERWTVPRSFSKQAYRDARKSRWGDIWALGAKTCIPRNLRLGTPEREVLLKDANGEVIGKGRGRKERLKNKARALLEAREEEKLNDLAEQREFMRELDAEFEESVGNVGDDFDDVKEQHKRWSAQQHKAHANANGIGHRAPKADRSVKPDRILSRYSSSDNNLSDEAVSGILADWEAEFTAQRRSGKGKKGGAFEKFGKSTKEAKRFQKGQTSPSRDGRD